MNFQVLGPLEVGGDEGALALGGIKQRSVLALLLLHANEVVSADRLIDALWGASPPLTARKTIQVYVSRLRAALGNDRLVTRPGGYVLYVEPEELDLARFEQLVAEARRAPAETAASKLREALALWHGPALADLAYEQFAQAEVARLEELRLAAVEQRVDADLELGRHTELVAELETHVAQHPLREHLRYQLMLALYRSDRQA
jgi:DNA-binding SARP family transcriptional activator